MRSELLYQDGAVFVAERRCGDSDKAGKRECCVLLLILPRLML
jgi:hypothetical protein